MANGFVGEQALLEAFGGKSLIFKNAVSSGAYPEFFFRGGGRATPFFHHFRSIMREFNMKSYGRNENFAGGGHGRLAPLKYATASPPPLHNRPRQKPVPIRTYSSFTDSDQTTTHTQARKITRRVV